MFYLIFLFFFVFELFAMESKKLSFNEFPREIHSNILSYMGKNYTACYCLNKQWYDFTKEMVQKEFLWKINHLMEKNRCDFEENQFFILSIYGEQLFKVVPMLAYCDLLEQYPKQIDKQYYRDRLYYDFKILLSSTINPMYNVITINLSKKIDYLKDVINENNDSKIPIVYVIGDQYNLNNLKKKFEKSLEQSLEQSLLSVLQILENIKIPMNSVIQLKNTFSIDFFLTIKDILKNIAKKMHLVVNSEMRLMSIKEDIAILLPPLYKKNEKYHKQAIENYFNLPDATHIVRDFVLHRFSASINDPVGMINLYKFIISLNIIDEYFPTPTEDIFNFDYVLLKLILDNNNTVFCGAQEIYKDKIIEIINKFKPFCDNHNYYWMYSIKKYFILKSHILHWIVSQVCDDLSNDLKKASIGILSLYLLNQAHVFEDKNNFENGIVKKTFQILHDTVIFFPETLYYSSFNLSNDLVLHFFEQFVEYFDKNYPCFFVKLIYNFSSFHDYYTNNKLWHSYLTYIFSFFKDKNCDEAREVFFDQEHTPEIFLDKLENIIKQIKDKNPEGVTYKRPGRVLTRIKNTDQNSYSLSDTEYNDFMKNLNALYDMLYCKNLIEDKQIVNTDLQIEVKNDDYSLPNNQLIHNVKNNKSLKIYSLCGVLVIGIIFTYFFVIKKSPKQTASNEIK